MRTLFLLILIFLCFPVFGQEHCFCPTNTLVGSKEGSKPETHFTFSNKQRILLCGYKEENAEELFSEFLLQVCGKDSIIDFWDALQLCRVKFEKDTLKVTEIMNLPIAKNRKYALVDWSIENIYFINGKLNRDFQVNPHIRKYTRKEIRMTLSEFENADKIIDDNKMELLNRLFISSISGSQQAKKYFRAFEKKFGELDGAFAEEYNDLSAMLRLYK